MKILGIDYGSKTIGLSILNTEVDFIYPLETLVRERENVLRKSLSKIASIVVQEGITKIVVGLPLSMDDSSGKRVFLVKEFTKKLKLRVPKEVEFIYQDERLSTIEAKELLLNRGIKKENLKEKIDCVAAMIILEDWRNENAKQKNNKTTS